MNLTPDPQMRAKLMGLVAGAALMAACDTRHEPHAPLHYGASGQFDVESLDVYGLGRTIHLLLAGAEAEGGKQWLRYLRSDNAGRTWSQPVRINAAGAGPYGLHRGNDAQIAASGDRLVAAWQSEGTGWGGSGPLATAVSRDGGRSWRLGSNPADDGKTEGHGFIDIAADESGGFHLVWLDGRSGDQALYYARSDNGGHAWSSHATLDDLTCECCWNTLATSGNQVYALYRDSRPRDMAVTASMNRGNTWRPSTPRGKFQLEV